MIHSISRTFLLLAVCCIAHMGLAQHTSRTVIRPNLEQQTATLSFPVNLDPGNSPFLAVSVKWAMTDASLEPASLQIRFSETENWTTLAPDPHATFQAPLFISSLLFTQPENRHFQIRLSQPGSFEAIDWLEVHVFAPGKSRKTNETKPEEQGEKLFCPCPQPNILLRDDWCPSGDCPEDTTPQPTTVTHLIVHHSAGTNSASDWAAVVRAIWDYHVNGNGWDDIGYNWLVDPNGEIYEGRGNNRQGAHFCGFNSGTAGFCVLGNFTDVAPQTTAIDALVSMLAWKSCESDIDPQDFSFHNSSGLNLFHISGHRDGCSTACPGDVFYDNYFTTGNPVIRIAVADHIENACATIAAPSDLGGSSPDETTISLSWTDNSNNEDFFSLERSTSGDNNFSEIALLGFNTESFEDTNLNPGIYDYRLRALNITDTSAYSNIFTIATLTSSVSGPWPESLVHVFPNPFTDAINLQFEDGAGSEISFKLFASDGRLLAQKLYPAADLLTIPTHELPSGLYFLKVTSGQRHRTYRLIKP